MNSKPTRTARPALQTERWNRRRFVHALALSGAAAGCLPGARPGRAAAGTRPSGGPPSPRKVAIVCTEIRKYSHAEHFVDRCLEGYGWHGQHHYPPFELAGLYVDQFPEGDLARERSARFRVKLQPTIAQALTLGTSRLAVDGVMIIGEHGNYPRNEKGQTLYPRYRFFKEVVKVFEASGQAVPVFNDKHLATNWDECLEMVADSRRLGFPFLAGSSLPVTWRIPALELPHDTPLLESLCVCYGGVDSYDIHGLETAQCMSERRAGGETGVKSVLAVRGARVCDLIEEREPARRLMFAALARSHTCRPKPGYTFSMPDMAWVRANSDGYVGYFIEHRDGFRTTLLMLNGLVQDFTYAGLLRQSNTIVSCQMHLPMPPRLTTVADFFNPQFNNIEQMILTGSAPYPVERTLLTSGMTLSGVESLHRGQVLVETPELQVAYAAPRASTFWRA
jgi:hypothetical protein